MGMRYDLGQIPSLRDLVLEVDERDDGIGLYASGPWADTVAPYLKSHFDGLSSRGSLARLAGGQVYSLYLPPVPSRPHARMIEGIIRTSFFKQPTPQAVTISVTRACQCQCVHCTVPGGPGQSPSLSTEEITRIVGECIELGVNNVTFTGGDPLLRRDLEELVAAVSPDMAVVQVFTNGLALDARRARSLKAAGVFSVQICLNSADEDEHDRLCGFRGAYRAVRRAVAHALDAGILVGLSAYATNSALADGRLERLVDRGAEWGAHEISVFDLIPAGRFLQREDFLLTDESRRILREIQMLHNGRDKNLPRVVTQSWSNSGRGFARSFGCLAGHYQFHITACGDVLPCDFTPITFGNVRDHAVRELWQKLSAHPAWCRHQDSCRMQSPEFRRQYIHAIPVGTDLPIAIEVLDGGTPR